MTDKFVACFTIFVFSITLLQTAALAETLSVPSDYATLAQAIAAAEAGDVVEIAPGRYAEYGLIMKSGLQIIGKGQSPQDVIIDGNGRGRILLCEGLTQLSRLDNITFTGGHAAGHNSYDQSGGAVLISHSLLNIRLCDFLDNRADAHGGAIRASYSSPTIEDCRFIGNTAPAGGGGGIDCSYGSSPQIRSSSFERNYASWGGGIACRGDSGPIVAHSTFLANSVLDGKAYGGAVFADFESTPLFDACTFVKNAADFGGGLACFQNSATHLVGCTVAGNEVTWLGGGLFSFDASPVISQCIFVYQEGTSLSAAGNSVPYINRSNFFQNTRGDWAGLIANQLETRENVSLDPMFCSSDPIGEMNFALQSDSPCAPGSNPSGLIGAWAADCNVTPVLSGNLSAQWVENQAHLFWSLMDKNDTPEFRLTGARVSARELEWDIPITTTSVGEFFAIDQILVPEPDTQYVYRLYSHVGQGNWLLVTETTLTSPPPAQHFPAMEAWPNPFNPSTTIGFSIKREQGVRVCIFDLEGQLVRTLLDEHLSPGRHEVVWDGLGSNGQQLSSGTYIALVDGQTTMEASKLTLLK